MQPQKFLLRDHLYTYQPRSILLNKVLLRSLSSEWYNGLIFQLVIVTEKTNMLLRYLHQQWERKVQFFSEALLM